jgi:MFS family permease
MSSSFGGRWLLLAFGFAFAFFSNFGQTPFIAVFGGAIRSAFDLSNGAWGAIYFVATLTSGLLITKVGALIDTIPLRRYAVATVIGLALATGMMAASSGLGTLALAVFFLRLFGQGLMTHVGVTAMAREFTAARGRAVAIASMGLPAGSSLFPLTGALAVTELGWRGGWIVSTVLCLLAVLPLALILLRGYSAAVAPSRAPFAALRFLAQKDMLLALPALMAMGFIGTAVAFHQVVIADAKGWPLTLFASGFAVLGIVSIVATLASGWLVDHLGARRPALVFLLPMVAACLVLALSDAPAAIFIHMALMGISAGAYAPVTTSLLAEAYGVERFGAIRATAAAVTVVSTSLSPLLFGVLVDFGISVDVLIAGLGLLALTAAVMLGFSGLTRRGKAEGLTA